MSRQLPNYLRTYRKRAGLSQDEVAFLLGYQSGTRVSRYEQFDRVPALETALACEAILGIPARELFAGAYARVAEDTRRRAGLLVKKVDAPGSGTSARKHTLLAQLAAGERPRLNPTA